MARTLCIHCSRQRFSPWLGNYRLPMPRGLAEKKKERGLSILSHDTGKEQEGLESIICLPVVSIYYNKPRQHIRKQSFYLVVSVWPGP